VPTILSLSKEGGGEGFLKVYFKQLNYYIFLNHIDDCLTIGYWVIGDYLVPPWRDWNLVIGYSFYD